LVEDVGYAQLGDGVEGLRGPKAWGVESETTGQAPHNTK
jgi:hypothetical protein